MVPYAIFIAVQFSIDIVNHIISDKGLKTPEEFKLHLKKFLTKE